MIFQRIWPLANDQPEDLASYKWSSRESSLLQMIIWRIQPLANDHPEDPSTCKWSFGGTGHLQMIIQRIWPLANDHLEDIASRKWSSWGTGLLQMIIRHPHYPNHLSQDPDSISRTFLEQFDIVCFFGLWWAGRGQKSHLTEKNTQYPARSFSVPWQMHLMRCCSQNNGGALNQCWQAKWLRGYS